MRTLAIISLLAACAMPGAEIVLPGTAFERTGTIPVVYRTNAQATGRGVLSVRWTDALGRVVDERKIPVELTDEMEAGFDLDLRRAVAMKNQLHVEFVFEGKNKKGEPDRRNERAQTSFVARPPERKWRDYTILMWQNHTREQSARLKELGINAGQYNGKSRTPPDFLLDNDMRWYAENIATDFYSEYHRYRSDRIQNWSFLNAKELYQKNPSSLDAFKRNPSLSDPVWLAKIHDRLVESARNHSPYRPVFYSLGDESGIADLAAFWDFDFSDQSLVEMRAWLKQRYGSLAALNAQWGTEFAAWPLVMPDTTNQAMKRAGENFSAWADHKEWMDISFARALKMGVDAVRSVDPDAYVGIGGAQMPGWGGYDYHRLARTLTAAEPYDIGNNIEILRSVNPALPVVTTSFATGPQEKHRVWYELLHGNRGLILWDEKHDFLADEGGLGPRGKEVQPYFAELRGGLAALLINSTRVADPIAIHYSQPSLRVEWMRAQRPKGEAWVRRGSSAERMDSEFLRLRESWCRLIEDLGLQYNFVTYGQVEEDELLKGGYRVVVLPRSSALSGAESRAIREFVAHGGLLIADGMPGVFDEHGKRLAGSSLADVFRAPQYGRGKAVLLPESALNYHQERLVGKEGATQRAVAQWIRQAGVTPEFVVSGEKGEPLTGIEVHRFRNGGVTIIGLHANPQMRVNELGPPEFKSNARFEKPRVVSLKLPYEMRAWDVRAGKALGVRKELSLTVDPFEPALVAFAPGPAPELQVSASQSGLIGLRMAPSTPAAAHVFHVDVAGPDGKALAHYSRNVLAANGRAGMRAPLAASDPAGKWEIRVRDLLTGQTRTVAMEVMK